MNAKLITSITLAAALSAVFVKTYVRVAVAQSAGEGNPPAKSEPHAALAIGDADFAKTVAKGVALVDFWAPWCGPCRMQGPIVERVAEAVGAKAVVAKVNVDDNPATAEKFAVSSIPTLIVFKDGKPVKRFVGVQSEETLTKAIEEAAGQ